VGDQKCIITSSALLQKARCVVGHGCNFQSLAGTNPHWARVVGYGLFSLCVIHKEGVCHRSGDINRLTMMMYSRRCRQTLQLMFDCHSFIILKRYFIRPCVLQHMYGAVLIAQVEMAHRHLNNGVRQQESVLLYVILQSVSRKTIKLL
jgi:hypothetical protein